jgi:hypothetical protein
MQGDQIWRILVYWAIVYFGQLLQKYRTSPNFWDSFFHEKVVYQYQQKSVWATV